MNHDDLANYSHTEINELRRELAEAKAERDAARKEIVDNAVEDRMLDQLLDPTPDLRADLSRWRALAEELAEALDDLIASAGYAFRQPESEFDSAAELEEPRKALARYRAANADGPARKEEA